MADYINDIIDAVMDMAEATEPYAAIVRGPLPPDNGISIYMANGTPNATFLNTLRCGKSAYFWNTVFTRRL